MSKDLMNLIAKEIPAALETMTSLQIVELINKKLELDGDAALLHHDFIAKVPQVLGVGGGLEFQATYLDDSNRQSTYFILPMREVYLMLMTYNYDYDVQAAMGRKGARTNEAKASIEEGLGKGYVKTVPLCTKGGNQKLMS